MTLTERIEELIAKHGSLRAAARVLECDAGYLSRLASGEKDDPGPVLLRRMGLRQVVTYERTLRAARPPVQPFTQEQIRHFAEVMRKHGESASQS